MNKAHRHYEMQSALAALGQLTDVELADLELHAATCTSCRNHLAAIAEISRICFLWHASRIKERVPEGMQERFVEWAAHAGIPLSNLNSRMPSFRSLRVAAIVFVLCLATSLGWQASHVRNASQSGSEATSNFIQPLGTVGPIHPSPWSQSTAVASTKVAQLEPKPMNRRWLGATRRRLVRPTLFSEPNVGPLAWQGQRFLTSNHSTDWFQQSPVSLLNPARYARERSLLPGPEFLTCMKHTEDCRPEVRAFFMDPTLMSFAYLETPVRLYAATSRSNLQFAAPEFHLRLARSW